MTVKLLEIMNYQINYLLPINSFMPSDLECLSDYLLYSEPDWFNPIQQQIIEPIRSDFLKKCKELSIEILLDHIIVKDKDIIVKQIIPSVIKAVSVVFMIPVCPENNELLCAISCYFCQKDRIRSLIYMYCLFINGRSLCLK